MHAAGRGSGFAAAGSGSSGSTAAAAAPGPTRRGILLSVRWGRARRSHATARSARFPIRLLNDASAHGADSAGPAECGPALPVRGELPVLV